MILIVCPIDLSYGNFNEVDKIIIKIMIVCPIDLSFGNFNEVDKIIIKILIVFCLFNKIHVMQYLALQKELETDFLLDEPQISECFTPRSFMTGMREREVISQNRISMSKCYFFIAQSDYKAGFRSRRFLYLAPGSAAPGSQSSKYRWLPAPRLRLLAP